MKASQFSDEQIGQIVQPAERDDQTIGAVCRAHGRQRKESGFTEAAKFANPPFQTTMSEGCSEIRRRGEG
jgi:hypothetical protein